MSQDDVERVARAICAEKCAYMGEPACWTFKEETWPPPTCDEPGCVYEARAALSAMPPRLSPDLIAQLNKLASRLTAQGEYDAVDLIDTVVARVSGAALEHDKGEHQP